MKKIALAARRLRRHPFVTIAAGLLLVLGGPSPSVLGQNRLTFLPSATDPAIRLKNRPHVSLLPEGNAQGRLLLFLPGTRGEPGNYIAVLNAASTFGLHVLGLCYENSLSVNYDLCGSTQSETCHYDARYENLTGEDRNPTLNIGPADALLNRLRKALVYLQTNQPEGNWNQFVNPQTGEPDWERIVVAGHSQGGGMSLFIARHYPVARAVSFAGIDWMGTKRKPAPWASDSLWATPSDRLYGFTHTDDDVYNNQPAFWQAIGARGPIVDVDTCRDRYYYSSHTLITRLPPRAFGGDSANYHGSVVIGAFSPVDSTGRYVYEPVWHYLLAGASATHRRPRSQAATPLRPWPNPSSEVFAVELPAGPCRVSVHDMQGRPVWSGSSGTSVRIALTDRPAGLYWLRVESSDQVGSAPLLLQR